MSQVPRGGAISYPGPKKTKYGYQTTGYYSGPWPSTDFLNDGQKWAGRRRTAGNKYITKNRGKRPTCRNFDMKILKAVRAIQEARAGNKAACGIAKRNRKAKSGGAREPSLSPFQRFPEVKALIAQARAANPQKGYHEVAKDVWAKYRRDNPNLFK